MRITTYTYFSEICCCVNIKSLTKGQDLNDRQKKAVEYVIANDEISNRIYQELNSVSRVTAIRDLNKLVSMEILKRSGKGKAIVYKIQI